MDCKLCQCHCHRSIVQVMKHPFARACFMLEPPPCSKLSNNCCVNVVPCVRLLDAIASVPEEILAEMAQLTKENSIEGCKASVIGLFSTAFICFSIFSYFFHFDMLIHSRMHVWTQLPSFKTHSSFHSTQRFREDEAAQCDIVYTPFLNLKKEDHMEVGQVQNFGICWEMGTGTDWSERSDLGSGGWLQRGIIPNLDEERGQGQHSKI